MDNFIANTNIKPGTWIRIKEQTLLWRRPYQIFELNTPLDYDTYAVHGSEKGPEGYIVTILPDSVVMYVERCSTNPIAIKVWFREYFGWIHLPPEETVEEVLCCQIT